jgi:alkyl sulfatase BDS1-like metallo-beta-lactamase superfamily hydrolase
MKRTSTSLLQLLVAMTLVGVSQIAQADTDTVRVRVAAPQPEAPAEEPEAAEPTETAEATAEAARERLHRLLSGRGEEGSRAFDRHLTWEEVGQVGDRP